MRGDLGFLEVLLWIFEKYILMSLTNIWFRKGRNEAKLIYLIIKFLYHYKTCLVLNKTCDIFHLLTKIHLIFVFFFIIYLSIFDLLSFHLFIYLSICLRWKAEKLFREAQENTADIDLTAIFCKSKLFSPLSILSKTILNHSFKCDNVNFKCV